MFKNLPDHNTTSIIDDQLQSLYHKKKASRRQLRVASTARKIIELAIFEQRLNFQALEKEEKLYIPITSLTITRDLRNISIKFSINGDKDFKTKQLAHIKKMVPAIRNLLSKNLHLHKTPYIYVMIDDTPEITHRIGELLRQINTEKICKIYFKNTFLFLALLYLAFSLISVRI